MMIDLSPIRERLAMGEPDDLTTVDLGFLAQALIEIEQGRKARAELERLQSREGMTFSRANPL